MAAVDILPLNSAKGTENVNEHLI